MGPWRVVVVSDSHLTARVANTDRNWTAALRHIESAEPDLVVHVGDISMDGARDPGDLRDGRAQMDKVPAPWRAIPGNHDVGDTISAYVDSDEFVTADRVGRWRDLFGPDRWTVDLGRWRLIGVNAQLFGSGLPAEAEQWDFIENELGRLPGAQRRLLLVSHKPLAASGAELEVAPPYRFVPSPARDRLWKAAQAAGVHAVLSGHVHQARVLEVDGITQLWAPTTWAVLPETMQRTVGTKRCGVMQLELPDDGPLVHQVVEPDGMAQLVISEGVPYPPPH